MSNQTLPGGSPHLAIIVKVVCATGPPGARPPPLNPQLVKKYDAAPADQRQLLNIKNELVGSWLFATFAVRAISTMGRHESASKHHETDLFKKQISYIIRIFSYRPSFCKFSCIAIAEWLHAMSGCLCNL
jgi:hypothetical protein